MGIKFFGGPYDGVEADHHSVNLHATILPIFGDLEARSFVLMPPPESWAELVRGGQADAAPLYPYERVFTPDGPRFEWAGPGRLDHALLESRLKVRPRARSALSALPPDLKRAVVGIVAELQKTEPEDWPGHMVQRLSPDNPVHIVRLPSGLRAFVQRLGADRLELIDIAREDTLKLFADRHGTVGSGT